ncbi:pre-rRNA-processing protein TSR2-like [Salvia splendens]|uniref:pre-rRNA-processing protein TSR2-like n=1 Tax=Salvia splendens TaxID=180675 RepID=UPI001C25E528|nr:pre-rRNA-processing protein TSR2-like [Salvia splendens]
MNNHRMTPEAAAHFGDGIQMVVSRWAALRMAIENGWGGRDSLHKSQQLGHNLFNFLTQSKDQVYIVDVEDILYEFMDSLNTEIQDGSVEEPNSDDEEDNDEDDAIIENNMSAMEVDAPQPQRQLDHNLTDIVADDSSTKDTPQVGDG